MTLQALKKELRLASEELHDFTLLQAAQRDPDDIATLHQSTCELIRWRQRNQCAHARNSGAS